MAAKNKNNKAVVLDEVLTQFVNAYIQGERPDLDDFIERYPQYEAQIRRRVGGLREIDALFDSLVQSEGDDYVDTSAERNLVGQKIGGFEIVEMIGRGGMGVVYLARDTRLKRSVAIKSMPPQWKKDAAARIRFRREAELLALLNHPNIAVIHDIIEQEDRSGYLVLEYVPGETLSERIRRETLTMDEALSIGRQIAEAISAAHKKGIVHRDLKPGNIKITPDGQVKVLDFGLAKPFAKQDKKSEITETQPGRVIGTPAYMSPEQARGKETDHRTDIWSFGCMMYQMLSGHLPFEGETATDTLARIIEREPDWQTLPKNTPENIRVLLRRCLEKNPDQRLGDITDAVIEITEVLSAPPRPLPVRLRNMAITVGVTIIIILSAVGAWLVLGEKNIAVVVLPFETLKPVEDEDVTAGMTSEITDHLAKIHGLSVISYRTARQYQQTDKTIRQIADELHVDYILEGTVQYEYPLSENSLVSITSRLINMSNNAQVWSDTYDRTMKEVSKIPFDVAKEIAQATDITLSPEEQRALAYMPTYNTEAYACYVRGNSYFSRPLHNKENMNGAIQWFEKATSLDDTFALAFSKLSVAYSAMYLHRDELSEERLKRAWEASEKALKLDPQLPEAHWARGVYYLWGRSDSVRALDELTIARKAQPNNSDFLANIGYVKRQQGKREQALTNLRRAFEINPRDSCLAMEIGATLIAMRKYQEAESHYEQAIVSAPDEPHPYYLKARLYLVWKGSTQKARDVLERASKYINLAKAPRIVDLGFGLDVLDRKFEEALARLPLESPSIDKLTFFDALLYAQIYRYKNEIELAKSYYDKVRIVLEPKVKEYPNSRAGLHMSLGIAYAGLGRKKDAIQRGKTGLALLRNRNTARDMAQIYIMVEEFDSAINEIEYLLSVPGALSIPLLRLDPAWDPLRDHPRFQKLLESEN